MYNREKGSAFANDTLLFIKANNRYICRYMHVAGHNVSLGAERIQTSRRYRWRISWIQTKDRCSVRLRAIRTYVNLYFHVINDKAVKILGNSEERDMYCFPFIMRTIPLLSKLIVITFFRVLEHLYTTISDAIILLVLRNFSSKKSFLLLSTS